MTFILQSCDRLGTTEESPERVHFSHRQSRLSSLCASATLTQNVRCKGERRAGGSGRRFGPLSPVVCIFRRKDCRFCRNRQAAITTAFSKRLFSLHFFCRRYRRYRALFCGDNALSIANILFLLAFLGSVIDVIDVIGTFAICALALGLNGSVIMRRCSMHCRFAGETPA